MEIHWYFLKTITKVDQIIIDILMEQFSMGPNFVEMCDNLEKALGTEDDCPKHSETVLNNGVRKFW